MTCPVGLDSSRTLVIVDLSWWLARAFHSRGVEGMAPMVIGWLVRLLSDPLPWGVAVALDSVGPTWRHQRTAELEPDRRYKAGREPRPPEYYSVCNRIIDIIALHRIPLLCAEGWEADDCIAAAVPRALDAGLCPVILTEDKDLTQLCEDGCVLWDGEAKVTGQPEVRTRWGVDPRQIRDLLAIMGDDGDNVRGVLGLGQVKAAALLRAFGSLERCLEVVPEPPTEEKIKAAEKHRTKAKKAGGDALEHAEADLAMLRRARDHASWLTKLKEARATVELARELITLDASAPILWEPEELPVGGFDEGELRQAYTALGFSALARDVKSWPKAKVG